MRILLLNDFRIGGGAEIIFQKTYEVLVKQGYDVDMVYHNGRISPQGSIFSYVFSIKNFRIILKRLREGKYDIIYVLNYAYSFSPSMYPSLSPALIGRISPTGIASTPAGERPAPASTTG